MSKYYKIRRDYGNSYLEKAKMAKNPIAEFEKWFENALKNNVPEANAMLLATVDQNNQPRARIMLLKDVSDAGFVFFSNYNSNKGEDLQHNNKAAVVIWWQPLHQQIRIEGIVEKTSETISDDYFKSRDKDSNISAAISNQSHVVEDRDYLEQKYQELHKKYENQTNIPRPKHWGGYILKPNLIEFWQGAANRLHDRIRYRKENNEWQMERLAP